MSWFSVSQHGKSLWDQHTFAKGILTGSFIGEYIYKNAVSENCINKRIKATVSEIFGVIVAPHFFPYSKEIATNILTHSLTKQKLVHVSDRLMQNFTTQNILTAGKTGVYAAMNIAYTNPIAIVDLLVPQPSSTARKMTNLVKFVQENHKKYSPEETKEIVDNLKKFEVGLATHKVLVCNLRPACEKAVKEGMISASKTLGKSAYDLSVKKIISVVTLPLIYKAALMALELSTGVLDGSMMLQEIHTIISATQQVVSPNTLLWTLAAINVSELMCIYFSAKYAPSNTLYSKDIDKEELKKLAIVQLQGPVSKKLQENEILTLAGITEDKDQADAIANTLINETIDLYWADLKAKKVLDLPIAC